MPVDCKKERLSRQSNLARRCFTFWAESYKNASMSVTVLAEIENWQQKDKHIKNKDFL